MITTLTHVDVQKAIFPVTPLFAYFLYTQIHEIRSQWSSEVIQISLYTDSQKSESVRRRDVIGSDPKSNLSGDSTFCIFYSYTDSQKSESVRRRK